MFLLYKTQAILLPGKRERDEERGGGYYIFYQPPSRSEVFLMFEALSTGDKTKK